MHNRIEIIAEYNDLRVLLNRPNKKKNEKTEICFRAVASDRGQFKLFATLEGESQRRLQMARQIQLGVWVAAELSRFPNLEDHCASFLRSRWEVALDVAVRELQEGLRSLCIPAE